MRRVFLFAVCLVLLLNPILPGPATIKAGESPLPLKGKVITLDPGHGGSTGARGPGGTYEDDNNLAIAFKLKYKLEAAGAKVIMTRTSDREAYLADRPWIDPLEAIVTMSSEGGADLFISIHNNWSYNSSARGIGTYYMPEKGTEWLASVIQDELIKATKSHSWGIIPAGFYVLRNAKAPAVLVEIGFISNWEDEQLLLTDWYRGRVAEGLYNGVLKYFGAKPVKEEPSVTPVGADPGRPESTPYEVWGYWARWGADPDPLASLKDHIDELDWVAPYWYTLMGDGTLKRREDDSTRKAVTSLVRSEKAKFVVMVNNDKSTESMIVDPEVRNKAVQNIYELVVREGFDGVHIDFERLSPSTRDYLTEFVKLLGQKLHPLGRTVTVAVVAKSGDDLASEEFAAAYDYGALGQLADRIVLMCYDRHGQWSGSGPVAPIDWVTSVVKYAVSNIPRDKILLGAACYGYDWSDSGTQALKAKDAVALASEQGSRIDWDDSAQEAHFTYWDPNGLRHEVWFENSFSLERKLDVVRSSRIKGIALWSIGQEDERTWQVLNSGLRGSGSSSRTADPLFPDVTGHECEEAVRFLRSRRLLDGYPDGTFRPNRTLSRAEFTKMVVEAHDWLHPQSPNSGSTHPGFPNDMDKTHWAYPFVTRAYTEGLVSGYPDGEFRPDFPLTRAEMVTMAVRVLDKALGTPDESSTGGEISMPVDVRSHWVRSYLERAMTWGIAQDFAGSHFMPDKPTTRGEAAMTVARIVQLTGK